MRFKRAVQRYGRTDEPDTPYRRAGQLWDERIGSARAQASNWRWMAFGELLLTTGLAGALVWQSMQSRVTPYVVAVDSLGQPQAVSPAAEGYRPTDPQIAWFLARFIIDIRARSLDAVLMRENWLQAYDFASKRGAITLGEYARSAAPFADVGDKTVSVQVTSVVRASANSFQVKWAERAFARGSLTGTSRWTAIVTVLLKPPRDAEKLRRNPLGLYVDAIDWSRELDIPADHAPSAASTAPASASTPSGPSLSPSLEPPLPARPETRP